MCEDSSAGAERSCPTGVLDKAARIALCVRYRLVHKAEVQDGKMDFADNDRAACRTGQQFRQGDGFDSDDNGDSTSPAVWPHRRFVMSYDVLMNNGTVVDGTGAPPYRADVAVTNGHIAEIGNITEGAKKVIDAADLVVAPGFIDPHTHYDAQICWDPLLTSSSWHGITTVVMGNCGVGLAPCKPEVREIATWDLVNVEAIPFEVLCKGVTWDWVSFPQFMAAAQQRGVGINVGFLAPLTPFRHYVMGGESMERAATAEEITEIAALLREALAAGALGWTTTTMPQHIGYQGRPLACRRASRQEFIAYANVLREVGQGAIEIALTETIGVLSEGEYELLELLLTESGRP